MADEYSKSSVWINLISEDGKYYIGAMQRCGITSPGYPKRATYYRYNEKKEINEVFVYDDGYFWNATEWRKFYRENGITPAEAQLNNGMQQTANNAVADAE